MFSHFTDPFQLILLALPEDLCFRYVDVLVTSPFFPHCRASANGFSLGVKAVDLSFVKLEVSFVRVGTIFEHIPRVQCLEYHWPGSTKGE